MKCHLLAEDTHFAHPLTVRAYMCVLIFSSVHTPPVIVLCQSHLLKVDVKPLAFRRLQDPVACQIVAVVARETRRDDATIGGIFYHSPTGCYMRRKTVREKRRRQKGWRVRLDEKNNETNYGGSEKSPCLSIDCINIQWTVAGLY